MPSNLLHRTWYVLCCQWCACVMVGVGVGVGVGGAHAGTALAFFTHGLARGKTSHHVHMLCRDTVLSAMAVLC